MTITQANRAALQAHLRTILRCPALAIDAPETQNGSAELRIGNDVVGTVDQVDEEGERSWAITLVVLEEDLRP